ncbi:MAG: hypothetical protein IPO92_09065 [Saprospiraceae bacterium]|nr:hypothetical protein [Saprospiraceae bacterium]
MDNKITPLFNIEKSGGIFFTNVVQEGQTIWLAGYGLIELNKHSNTYKSYDLLDKEGLIFAIVKDQEKGFYLGGDFDGIIYFDKQSRSFSKRFLFSNKMNTKDNKLITSIHKDLKNQLWVGTEKGLLKFDPIKDNIERTDILFEGHPVYINNILNDRYNNLWLGTSDGIFKYNPVTKHHIRFSILDGLLQNEYNRTPYLNRKTGEFWYGGINGINIFDPDSLKENTIVPPIEFTDIKYYKDESTPGPSIKGLEYINELNLSYDDIILEFKLAALNFNITEKNQYKYRVIGFQENWVNNGTKRTITLTNLSPGKYTLQVKACNNDGYWNEKGKSIEIIIQPPFWLTWWAKMFYFISMLSALLYYTNWRSSKLKKENTILEQKVIQRTQSLEQMQKKLLHTEKMAVLGEISRGLHDDIGTTLSKINLYSFMAQQKLSKNQEQDIAKTFASIQLSAQEMIEKLKDLLWSINPQNEDIGDLFQKIEQFASSMVETKGLHLVYDITTNVKSSSLSITEKYQLYLICKEAINNAVKYSGGDTLWVKINGDEKTLKIIIKDNGLGFNKDKIGASGRGIESMQKELPASKPFYD